MITKRLPASLNRLLKRSLVYFSLCLLPVCTLYAQTRNVSGAVLDLSGNGIPGVSVTVKNSVRATLSNEAGRFTIAAAKGDILVLSAVGYATKEVAVDEKTDIEVRLQTADKQMDEVVVVGYGTQKKSNLTSAVSSVKGDVIDKMATSNPINALQGRVSGLSVTSPGGNPGQMSYVRLRGVGTFGGHQPLYIIDGTPGDPFYLSNNDIASIEVLKDGAAASIYGSNSANGVILINTKKVKKELRLLILTAITALLIPLINTAFWTQMVTNRCTVCCMKMQALLICPLILPPAQGSIPTGRTWLTNRAMPRIITWVSGVAASLLTTVSAAILQKKKEHLSAPVSAKNPSAPEPRSKKGS